MERNRQEYFTSYRRRRNSEINERQRVRRSQHQVDINRPTIHLELRKSTYKSAISGSSEFFFLRHMILHRFRSHASIALQFTSKVSLNRIVATMISCLIYLLPTHIFQLKLKNYTLVLIAKAEISVSSLGNTTTLTPLLQWEPIYIIYMAVFIALKFLVKSTTKLLITFQLT